MFPLHKECESSFDESCSECRLELIKRSWTKILVNWINKCVNPDLHSVLLTPQCPVEIINKYRNDVCDNQLERIEAMSSLSEVEAFLKIKYPKLKLKNLNDAKELSNKLFVLSSILLFHCCVNSITGAVEGDICSKLSGEESQLILKFCETLALVEATVNNVEIAVKETCEPMVLRENRKRKSLRVRKVEKPKPEDGKEPCDAEFKKKFRSQVPSAKKRPVRVSTPILLRKKKAIASLATNFPRSSFSSDSNLTTDPFDSFHDTSITRIEYCTSSDSTIHNLNSRKVDVLEFNTDKIISGNKSKAKTKEEGIAKAEYNTQTIVDYDGTILFPCKRNKQIVIDDVMGTTPDKKVNVITDHKPVESAAESISAESSKKLTVTKETTASITIQDNSPENEYLEEKKSSTKLRGINCLSEKGNSNNWNSDLTEKADKRKSENSRQKACLSSPEEYLGLVETVESVSIYEDEDYVAVNTMGEESDSPFSLEGEFVTTKHLTPNERVTVKREIVIAKTKSFKTFERERMMLTDREILLMRRKGRRSIDYNNQDSLSLSSGEKELLEAKQKLRRSKVRDFPLPEIENSLQRCQIKESSLPAVKREQPPNRDARQSPAHLFDHGGKKSPVPITGTSAGKLISRSSENKVAKSPNVPSEKDLGKTQDLKKRSVPSPCRDPHKSPASLSDKDVNKSPVAWSPNGKKKNVQASVPNSSKPSIDSSDKGAKKTAVGLSNKNSVPSSNQGSSITSSNKDVKKNPSTSSDDFVCRPSCHSFNAAKPKPEKSSPQTPPKPKTEIYPRNLADIYKKKENPPCCDTPSALCRKVQELPPMNTYFSSSSEEYNWDKCSSKYHRSPSASEKGVTWKADKAYVLQDKSSGDQKDMPRADPCKNCKCVVEDDINPKAECKSCLSGAVMEKTEHTTGWMHNYARYFSHKMHNLHVKSYIFESLQGMPKWKVWLLASFALLPIVLIIIAIIASILTGRAAHKVNEDIKTVRLRAKLKITQPTWFWQCDNRLCKKVYQPKTTNTFTALSRCILICMGPQIWPHPIGFTHFSKDLVAVTTEKMTYKFRTVPSEILTSYIGDAFKLFIADLHRLEKVDLVPASNRTVDLALMRMNILIEVETDSDPRLRLNTDESYYLKVQSKKDKFNKVSKLDISISSPSFCGVRHGLETLSQAIMLDQTSSYLITLSELVIKDAPTYKYRGLMLDTARNYIPVSDIVRTIDGMAACKLNTFHWRISDSASFPLLLQSLPQLFEYGAYDRSMSYTREDIKHVVNRGIIRGIRILLEVAAPGPVGRAWSWSENANCPKKNDNFTCENVICLRLKMNEQIFELLQHIYTEIIEMTGVDDVFHLSDSIFSLSNCYYLIDEREGFLEKALQRLKHANKGVLPKLPLIWYTPHLNRDNEARYWEKFGVQLFEWPSRPDRALGKYKVLHSSKWDLSCEIKKQRCIKYRSWQEMYAWKSWRTIEAFAIVGGEALLWTDIVDSGNLDFHLWPRAAAVAERLWSDVVVNGTPGGDVYVRLDSHRWRMLLRGLKVQPIWPVWCSFHPHACLSKVHNHH